MTLEGLAQQFSSKGKYINIITSIPTATINITVITSNTLINICLFDQSWRVVVQITTRERQTLASLTCVYWLHCCLKNENRQTNKQTKLNKTHLFQPCFHCHYTDLLKVI